MWAITAYFGCLQVEAAVAAKQKAEDAVAPLRQSHRAELEAEKAHYEGLLQRARTVQVVVAFCFQHIIPFMLPRHDAAESMSKCQRFLLVQGVRTTTCPFFNMN